MTGKSLSEIRTSLQAFSKQWSAATRENADAKLFWARFYECFGIRPESATVYEHAVAKISGGKGFIDSFIPGLLIVEHKSRGKSLDSAFKQAEEYFLALSESDRPRYIITSDFARFRVYDLKADVRVECRLSDLHKHVRWFAFLTSGKAEPDLVEESPINRTAAYTVSQLHESLLRANFRGRDLEILLTRLLFCLFADDTGIFGEDGMFLKYIEGTRADGQDTGQSLAALFDVLDTPERERSKNLSDALLRFAYVNGSLFSEKTRIPGFDRSMREELLACARLGWADISPAIFGAMFQGVLEAHAPDAKRQASRRELGAHYTSERNILRVIGPLFMDGLQSELDAAFHNKAKLQALYDKLPRLTFLDPACGCGNFLVIAYRELRRLENEVIAALFESFEQGRGLLDVSTLCRVRVNQFYGMEIDEASAHIARVALWITDHQMNLESAQRFGNTRPTVPLVDTPHIHRVNALQTDWSSILPSEECSYVMGNPPFVGKANQTAAQKSDMAAVFKGTKSAGILDYVTAWYMKSVDYLRGNQSTEIAFVSTNSITQGEQVAALWPHLISAGVRVRFAHRTFHWSNEGKGNAAVHCVIIGFGLREPSTCLIFDYGRDIKAETPRTVVAKRINPYLIDAPDVVLYSRRKPLGSTPPMRFGNMPNDDGHLILDDAEKQALLIAEPKAAKWVRPLIGSEEFINSIPRWCLWLDGISASDLRAMPDVYRRVQAVRDMRLKSSRPATQKLASAPALFGEIRQPTSQYIGVPKTSSESRKFVPIGYLEPDVIPNTEIFTIYPPSMALFSLLNSTMHNAWLRTVGGRLKSDYRYSASIVYNNFPFPRLSVVQAQSLERAGQAIMDARATTPNQSLADLYDPVAMPSSLRKAHEANDASVDAVFGYKGSSDDAVRVAFLMKLHAQAVANVP